MLAAHPEHCIVSNTPGGLLEFVAIRNGNGDWLVKHAQTPPLHALFEWRGRF